MLNVFALRALDRPLPLSKPATRGRRKVRARRCESGLAPQPMGGRCRRIAKRKLVQARPRGGLLRQFDRKRSEICGSRSPVFLVGRLFCLCRFPLALHASLFVNCCEFHHGSHPGTSPATLTRGLDNAFPLSNRKLGHRFGNRPVPVSWTHQGGPTYCWRGLAGTIAIGANLGVVHVTLHRPADGPRQHAREWRTGAAG